MLNVKQLLAGKPHNRVWSVQTGQTVIEALELMAERNIGAVPVMDGDTLAGIFSERDYARKGILQGRKAKSTPITDVMTSTVFVVEPHHSIDDCMKLMTEKRIRHLPVVDHQQVIGLLSIGDIVNAIITEQKNRIQSLEHYITGAAF
jgi:CBS domain-containing protein